MSVRSIVSCGKWRMNNVVELSNIILHLEPLHTLQRGANSVCCTVSLTDSLSSVQRGHLQRRSIGVISKPTNTPDFNAISRLYSESEAGARDSNTRPFLGSVDKIDIQKIEARNLSLDTAVDWPLTCSSFATVHRIVQPERPFTRR